MASKDWYFTGMSKWAKVYEPEEKYGNYEINVYLDKASWKKFKESGISLNVKEDEDGEFVRFRRPDKRLVGGDVVEFGPPEIVDVNNQPFSELIGNGSKVTCKVTVYDTVKGKGHRLEAIRVEEHVPYVKKEVDTEVRAPF